VIVTLGILVLLGLGFRSWDKRRQRRWRDGHARRIEAMSLHRQGYQILPLVKIKRPNDPVLADCAWNDCVAALGGVPPVWGMRSCAADPDDMNMERSPIRIAPPSGGRTQETRSIPSCERWATRGVAHRSRRNRL
jgi:hypothetical protein